MRITVVFDRVECFFYCVDRDPAKKVENANFVVGAGFADAAEGSLHDGGADGPSVDVKIPSCVC